MRQNIAAYTALGNSYPPYISINREEDGSVTIHVRAPHNEGSDEATIRMEHGEFVALIGAVMSSPHMRNTK